MAYINESYDFTETQDLFDKGILLIWLLVCGRLGNKPLLYQWSYNSLLHIFHHSAPVNQWVKVWSIIHCIFVTLYDKLVEWSLSFCGYPFLFQNWQSLISLHYHWSIGTKTKWRTLLRRYFSIVVFFYENMRGSSSSPKYHWNWVLIPIWQRDPPCRSVWWLLVEETTGVDGIKQIAITWLQRIKVSAISHWINVMYVFSFLDLCSCWSLSYFVMADNILIPASNADVYVP